MVERQLGSEPHYHTGLFQDIFLDNTAMDKQNDGLLHSDSFPALHENTKVIILISSLVLLLACICPLKFLLF